MPDHEGRMVNGSASPRLEGLRNARICCALFQPFPTLAEAMKIRPAVSDPATGWRPTAARPMEAMQPHCSQSGSPPNWQGVIFVFKSADTVFVVRAKIHSAGLLGGDTISAISSLG